MAMRTSMTLAVAALAGGLALAAAPASAQDFNQSVAMCTGNTGPRATITGCTRLLTHFSLSPHNRAVAHYNRGVAYRHLNQNQKALADYSAAIRFNPRYTNAYYNRAIIYRFILKQHRKAIADNSQAIRLNPRFSEAYHNRALSYRALEQYRLAIADFTMSIRLGNPLPERPYANRGFAYAKLKQYPEAFADYEQALRRNPRYDQAYYYRGLTYEMLKQYPKAVAEFKKALAIDPNDENYKAALKRLGATP